MTHGPPGSPVRASPIVSTMIAANDTTEPTLTRGTTVQSAAWRAHRYDTHIEITDLRNAGKRGKTCPRFFISNPGYNTRGENLDPVAPFVLSAVMADVSAETMWTTLADVGQLGLDLRRTEERGCDVDREPTLTIDGADARGTFTVREFYVTFSATLTRPRDGSTFRHDTHLHGASRKDAAKAYAWAREHIGDLPRMSIQDFRAAMGKIGVQFR